MAQVLFNEVALAVKAHVSFEHEEKNKHTRLQMAFILHSEYGRKRKSFPINSIKSFTLVCLYFKPVSYAEHYAIV